MTDHEQIIRWRAATGRTEPTTVPLGLSFRTPDGMVVTFDVQRDGTIPKNAIAKMTGRLKPPKAKRHAPVKLASLPDGQEAEYARAMGRAV